MKGYPEMREATAEMIDPEGWMVPAILVTVTTRAGFS